MHREQSDDYLLVMTPGMQLESGEQKRIHSVIFIAICGNEVHRWTVLNHGSLATDLALLVDAGTALDLVRRLHKNETTLLPGSFDLRKIKDWMEGRSIARP